MKRRYSALEALGAILCADEDDKVPEDAEIEEETSEEEDDVAEESPSHASSDTEEDDESPNRAPTDAEEAEESPNRATTDAEEASEDEEPARTPECFASKDGRLTWSSSPLTRRVQRGAQRLRCQPGPTKYAVSRAKNIKSTFELFLPEQIDKIVLEMTNKQGRRVYGDEWTPIDRIDLQAFLGLLILAGVYRSSKEATESLWHALSGRNIFRATMSMGTFSTMSRLIRFDDIETRTARRKKDKLAPIRDVWDKWVCRLRLMYNPGADVTVDERLVAFRGRCAFKQYMPRKPSKYGVKIWVACDARTSYALNMQIYTGKSMDGKPEKNQGKRVVLDMTDGLSGHTVTCDNFFTSYALGRALLRRRMTMVGTVRKNKPELPPALMEAKDRAPLSSKFGFSETHTLVSYCPKKGKNVVLMSTHHCDAAVSARADKKPQIILDYNKNKGGVDTLDKVTSVYSCKRKTARWPLLVFFNILDVSVHNSFVLWREIDPTWNQHKFIKRRLFIEELGRELVTPLMMRRQALPRTPAAASLVMDARKDAASTTAAGQPRRADPSNPSNSRRRCKFCNNDNKTSTRCQKCDAYICRTHSTFTCQSCI